MSKRYQIIYVDMPWYRTPFGTAKTPYKTMTWEQLHAFDLEPFIDYENGCIVFAWLTGPTHLKECALVSSWCERFKLYEAGIAYRWIKTLRQSLPTMPPGYSLHGTKRRGFHVRYDCEIVEECCDVRGNGFPVRDEAIAAAWKHWRTYRATREWLDLVDAVSRYGIPIGASGPRPKLVKQLGEDVIALTTAKRGRAIPLLTEAQTQWVFAPKPKRGEHSRKPPIVRDRIVELLGDLPRIELFARGSLPEGWDGHGDEYTPALDPSEDSAPAC